jgi:hypothetical protein
MATYEEIWRPRLFDYLYLYINLIVMILFTKRFLQEENT